jgi:hypothetical protein
VASYTLIGNASIVQVLGPKVAADKEAATIQTRPTGIIATLLVDQTAFEDGTAGAFLTDFADSIEAIIAGGKAVGGSGSSSLDASNLQQYFVTFEVAYNPPGAPLGAVTTDVDVPVGLLSKITTVGGQSQIGQAEAMIDKAYSNLVSLAGGTPATAPAAAAPAPSQAATQSRS